jgi:hypothetical protein
MTNAVYPLYKHSLMAEVDTNKSLDQPGVNAPYVAMVTIDTGGYIYSDTHQFYTSLTAIVGTPQALTTNILVSNVFKADGIVFTGVTGTAIGALVIYRHNSGANGTWRLVLYEDTGIIGFPIVPNGGNLLITWNSQGIFAL